MTLSQIIPWAIAHPELALILAGAVVTAITSAYAAVKIAFQRVTGRAAKGGVWTVLDVAVELLPNAPGALNRLLRAGGARSLFAAPQAPTPPPSDPQRGAARVGALLVICGGVLLATLAGALVTACDPIREGVMRITPGVPDPSGCRPDSQRCAGAVPEVCSQSSMGNTRWWPSLSLRADGTQRVCSNGCVVDDAGVAGCAPPIPPNPFADASVTSEGGAL